jgi:hypothetical protein
MTRRETMGLAPRPLSRHCGRGAVAVDAAGQQRSLARGEEWGLGAVPSPVLGTLRSQVVRHRDAVAVAVAVASDRDAVAGVDDRTTIATTDSPVTDTQPLHSQKESNGESPNG